eukprot:comp22085_c2_seq1/m.32201 comp22085_c2_seq1/g.32201  ORF comp22085_c2_seq1/g.32201 comp22085_c2_seq1/m.32201 type:complete len:932 (-) comp22085_c2_seq1:38-2833(-)
MALRKITGSVGCLAASGPCVRVGQARGYKTKALYGFRQPAPIVYQPESAAIIANKVAHPNLMRLVTAYRLYGHQNADLDPLQTFNERTASELDLQLYGFNKDSATKYPTYGIVAMGDEQHEADIGSIVAFLERTYCGKIGAEFMHSMDVTERRWFADQFERTRFQAIGRDDKRHMLDLLVRSEVFDQFMAKRYPSVKRYGAEGAESIAVAVDTILKAANNCGVEELVVSMAHRGRLNVVTDILKYDPAALFSKISGKSELPPGAVGSGDVISHVFTSVDLQYGACGPMHVALTPNPSHLEASNPVAVGKTRAKQLHLLNTKYSNDKEVACSLGDKAMCLQIHGDAAFAGQGVVMETLGLANLPNYSVGGSVHLIVNNQVGFTTEPSYARSSRYSSDIAKMIGAPIIHCNGDDPEEVARACQVAVDYRRATKKDVLVDLYCYRRHGHNEMDDPSFTQPAMYKVIQARDSLPKMYEKQLVAEGAVDSQYAAQLREQHWAHLDGCMQRAKTYVPQAYHLQGKWKGYRQAGDTITVLQTGVAEDILRHVGLKSVEVPSDMTVHKRLVKSHIEARQKAMAAGKGIDWATAEALAMGTLLLDNYDIHLGGQDVGRGTFSQRHAMLVDQASDNAYVPLNSLAKKQGWLEIANSDLSELAVLGFAYGMSLENPRCLTIWEAQFGDFFNGAQIIIDTFISSGEAKWLTQSGLTMLLPHGYDGAGPEHSSCRIERFLQMCDGAVDRADGDSVNMHVVNPSTPAQYFHVLRRQMLRDFRKPLVVVAPKTLLRLPAATSSLSEMAPGTTFQSTIPDPEVDPSKVRRVVLCSGKVYYTLAKERSRLADKDQVAFVRLEELAPFPTAALEKTLALYPNATEHMWCQEEPENMGAWRYVDRRVAAQLRLSLAYVGREASAAPAVGISERHKVEAQALVDGVLKGLQ